MTFRRPTARVLAAATALAALGAVAACGQEGTGADPQRVDVAAAFYPLQFVTERVGGDAVRVVNLTKPGAEPHDLELTPGQVGEVSRAELIVYLSGFQPAVDEAVEINGGDRAFDVASIQPLLPASAGGHEHGGGEAHGGEAGHAGGRDRHLWLDPTRLAGVADRLAGRLAEVDPGRSADYTARAGTLRADLERLDRDFAEGLRTCQRREIVVSHTAFGYLAERYRLEQVGLTGLAPEDEPPPRRLAEVARESREHGATTIFFETLVSPKVAETVAREVGARTAVLDPLEGLSADDGGDYLSVMRTNLASLRTALDCS
ncbi:metal ABC transporter substrate-binding protein [Micromonospora okii]|uniref:metal ABC transporter substrate-binding protein n=1 Tax=Micromonospora okii TaxID=1182970 RepID=UPI001E495D82|nr:metal ABC transporter substrate-binding protein [Micromonospora okii]